MSRRKRGIAAGFLLGILTAAIFAGSMTSYAKTVTKNNYQNLNTDPNFYGDKTYINGCGVQGSITLSAGTAKKIDGKFYGSDSDTVIIKWKNALSACNVYLAKKLDVWQPSDGEQAAADYNHGTNGNDIYYYAGKTSGSVKVADSTSGSITVTLKELKGRPWICGSQETGSSSAPYYIQGFNYLGEDLVVIDDEAPAVSESASGTTGTGTDKNIWYKDSVNVKFTASDSGTGVNKIYVKSPGAADYTGYNGSSKELTFNAGGDNKFYYYADDKIGNVSAKANKTYKVDNAAPTAALVNTTQGFLQSAVLSASFSDSQSGVTGYIVSNSATPPSSGYTGVSTKNGSENVTVTANGTYYLHVKDAVGHTKTSGAVNVTNIDRAVPTVALKIKGQLVNNWYKGGAELTFTAADTGGSGVKSITVNNQETYGAAKTLSAPEGSTAYSYFSTDNAGNSSVSADVTVRVDKTAPVNVSLTGGTNSWTNDDVILTMKGQDLNSGLASLTLQYSADNTSWSNHKTENGGASTGLVTKNVKADKNGYYRVAATDNVGYTTIGSQIIYIDKIDKVRPDAKLEIDGELKNNGWYKGDTLLKFTAMDEGGSGVKSITVNGNEKPGDKLDLNALEGTNTYIYTAADNAGSSTIPAKQDTIKVDKTSPAKLTMTPDKKEWTSEPINVTIHAEDKQSGIEKAVLEYSKDKASWSEYKRYNYQESIPANSIDETTVVTDNGYYRLAVTDRVGYVTTSPDEDILEITNYDPIVPNADTIGIEQNTLQWVNEETGVEVTSYGSDEQSGLATVEVWERNQDTLLFNSIKVNEYNGETSIEKALYDTHKNNHFKTSITDQAGNKRTMKDREALVVENIDSQAPEISMEALSDIEEWISADNGFKIKAILQDKQSGTNEIILQKLMSNEGEAEQWVDTDIEYKVISVLDKKDSFMAEGDSGLKLSKSARERVLVASKAKSDSEASANLGTVDKDNEEEILQCETGTITVEFTVRENGTYRLKGVDLVKNTAVSENFISITKLDDIKPVIRIEGNPEKWQNKDAVITVTAIDDTNDIVEMTLDGKSMNMGVNENGECYFTFKAPNNKKFSVTAKDEAGNVTEETVDVTKIDKEPPLIVTGIEPEWQNGYRNLGIIVTDGLSGIKRTDIVKNKLTVNLITGYEENALNSYECYYKINENGRYCIYAEDIAGNMAAQELEEKEAKLLRAIEVVEPPEKTVYYKKQSFKKKGMIVDAVYNDNSRKNNISDYIILNGENLPLKQEKIDLSYTEDGITVYADTPITVKFSIIPKPDKPDEADEEDKEPKKPENTDGKDNSDSPDNTKDKDNPIEGKTIISSPEYSNMIDEKEKSNFDTELVEIKENESDIVKTPSSNTSVKRLPIGQIIGGAILLLLVLLISFYNVRVYAQNSEGEYKLIGRLRVKGRKDEYYLKINNIVISRAETNFYKFTFTKIFRRFHDEFNLTICLDKSDYECFVAKEKKSIYIEYRG